MRSSYWRVTLVTETVRARPNLIGMPELDQILDAIVDWTERGVEFALATVVGVRGSTYRGLGARQLVSVNGVSVGTVSGGCLDQDLHAVARRVTEQGQAELVAFDLTADDEAIWGWGIGCNGVTELLVEPSTSARDLASHLSRIRAEQRPVAILHTLDGAAPGRRVFVSRSGVDGSVGAEAVSEARRALDEGWHRVVDSAGERIFIEVVGAPSRLVVCGAGHDAAPLVAFGARLGFEVTVVDDRRQFLSRERFPEASHLVHAEPSELRKAINPDPRTYVVLMSHNYLRDLDYLRSLLDTDVAYIGALGPGTRLQRLLDDLASEEIEVGQEDLSKLHGPAGLDVGAEGPDEIAWTIMAEILAVRRGKTGGPLRGRKGPEALRKLAWQKVERSET